MIKCRLRVLLAERDMQQKDLVELTGVRSNTVSNMFNNKTKQIPIEALGKICDALNCEVGDIYVNLKSDNESQK